MKRILIGKTYDDTNRISMGWTVETSRQRDGDYMVVLTFNSNWQGYRDGGVVQVRDCDTQDEAIDLAKELLNEDADTNLWHDIEQVRLHGHPCYQRSDIIRVRKGDKVF